MFIVEQRALADRLEMFLGVRICEVSDPTTIRSEKLRASVMEGGRCSWYSKDGGTLYIFSENLNNNSASELFGEVIAESVAQKGFDFLPEALKDSVMQSVWSRASTTNKASIAMSEGVEIQNMDSIYSVGARKYLSLIESKGGQGMNRLYEDVALTILTKLYECGFENVMKSSYYIPQVVTALKNFNRYHPFPMCSLEDSKEVSRRVLGNVRKFEGKNVSSFESCLLSFGPLSPEYREVLGLKKGELEIKLGTFMAELKKHGLSVEDFENSDIANSFQHPVAVLLSSIDVATRDFDGKVLKDPYGGVVKHTVNRYCVLTDIKVTDIESGKDENLVFYLPSYAELKGKNVDDVVIRGFSPKNGFSLARSVENGSLLYCDARMAAYFNDLLNSLPVTEDFVEGKKRRRLQGDGPDVLDLRRRLIYSTNIVKNYLSDNGFEKKVESDKEIVENSSDVELKTRRNTSRRPAVRIVERVRTMDIASKLKKTLSERDFTPSVYKSLVKNGIHCAMDFLKCNRSALRKKDIGEMDAYMSKIGVSSMVAKKSAGIQSGYDITKDRPYPYLVDNIVYFVVGEKECSGKDDLVEMLSQFGFDARTMEQYVDDCIAKSADHYVDLTEEELEDIRQDVLSYIQPDKVLEKILEHRLNGSHIHPDCIVRVGRDGYECLFTEDDVYGESYIVNLKGDCLHEGYFPCDLQEKKIGFSIDGEVLRGQVVKDGEVQSVEVNIGGESYNRGKKL